MNSKSFALWYDSNSKDNDKKVSAEMHYNFWKLPNKKKGNFDRFFDIGIKLTNVKQIKELKLYVPLSIDKSNFRDLGHIAKNNDLLCTVFNAKLDTKNVANMEYHEIIDSNDEDKSFYIYVLGDPNVRFEPNSDGGTIMSFSFTGTIPNKDNIYIRFRLKGKILADLGFVERPSNSMLQSAFSNSEMLDIRINEARVLHNKLLEVIRCSSSISFSKTHFFFICNSKEEYIFSHLPPVGCRRLENDKWNKYIEEDYDLDLDSPILAYHWKINQPHEEYSALVKTKYEQNNVMSIIKYLVVLAIITILFNLLSSFLYSCF